MSSLCDLKMIIPLFQTEEREEDSHPHYRNVILHTLRKILPVDFFEYGEDSYLYQKNILERNTPLVTCSKICHFPGTLSFFGLSKYRMNSFKFFFEMISRWLIPGRRLKVVLVCASDFRLTPLSKEVYTLSEVMVEVLDGKEFEEIQSNLPMIESEILLGMQSEFYSKRIMEIKGLSSDDKIALIQDFISSLVKRFPSHYDSDIFTEMQHVLLTCSNDFKARRTARHLSRIIGIQYLFRQFLKDSIKKSPHRRHLNLKIFRSFIHTSTGSKPVLSLLVGINFLKDQENFGEKHLIKAIQCYIPSAVSVEGSFFVHKLVSENICLSYIEVEKKDASPFSIEEICKLRLELGGNLKNRVEHRLPAIFMPRNEEEVLRNILSLANQIKYVRDIPQVFITFEEQAYTHLYFVVIVARLLKGESSPLAELFKKSDTIVEYLHDRTKIMGYVRKKYAKEATVFRLKLPKERFIRADHSIDLYKARQMVVSELSKVLGEIRDYNGGMISKQYEVLLNIRNLLINVQDYDELLLENFFYSLVPVVMRSLLDPKIFKTLFLMLLKGLKDYKGEGAYVKFYREVSYTLALILFENSSVKDHICRAIENLHIPSTELVYTSIKTHDCFCIGYICYAQDSYKKEQFLQAINEVLAA